MPKLSLLDQGFLLLESKASPRHVAGLQLFGLPPGAPSNFLSTLVESFRSQPPIPPFNWKLRTSAISAPSWIEDSEFDIDHHLFHEALPSPGSMEQLRKKVARLHASLLDRSRPMWEIHIFEGLQGKRFAVYTKIHHAYMDGVTMSRRSMESLSTDPDDCSIPVLWANQRKARRHARVRKSMTEALFGTARDLTRKALLGPRVTDIFVKQGLKLLTGKGEVPTPFTAPKTLFNKPLTPTRAIGICSLPLDKVSALAHRRTVTVNDVILTICDMAMRRYLDDLGQIPKEPLVAEMPVSLRSQGSQDSAEDSSGNHLAIVLLEMASTQSDPLIRLSEVHRSAEKAKRDVHAVAPEAAEAYTLLTQTVAMLGDMAGVAEKIRPLGNVVISNLIGDDHPRYLHGAPMLALFPISTIAPNTAMNITIYTQAGQMHFGLLSGKAAIPNPQSIADYIVEAFAHLKKASDKVAPAARPKATRSRKKPVKKKSAKKTPLKKSPVKKAAAKKMAARGRKARKT